ncbi:CRISPR-associated endonuclease Cas3'' [Deinococcus metallilatus]|nr:CRISPR-associated endonuclease Cas3'' [Deinococcus metallilatus]MBB5293199.1 CRISPR-associated helicase Cas3/CRISPR-associated endonuclease Cas3-HD [Deinococcus metallilatus]GMA15577.1 CRISPR-associated helicase/endonuclease Cas3 [Deinococcus metallilatus]
MTMYYGHTFKGDKTKQRWQTMREHALNVAGRACEHAEAFGEKKRAHLAGLLHDLGKYGDLFQRRLEGEGSGFDHWSAGACFAKQIYKDGALALVIQGHHIGLQKGDGDTLDELAIARLQTHHPLELRLTETDLKLLASRLLADVETLPPGAGRQAKLNIPQGAADMLDTRMLFSALVDADYLDTEQAMREDGAPPRPHGPSLDAVRALAALERHLATLNADERVPEPTRTLRTDLMNACHASGERDGRLWTLTAPTGSGKTLAMLRFALTRAVREQNAGRPLRRIVVVLPFLSILDQTVQTYREIFSEAEFGPHFVLEHHSLTGTRTDPGQDGRDDGEGANNRREAQLLTQNWDAPIVITTSVQLLESLHANRPGACRKLHRLAGSALLLDEVQTLPAALAVPTLKTLSRLASEKYGAVVVMATATQPAFDTLDEKVRQSEPEGAGWQPQEMAPPELRLFERSRRVRPVWNLDTPTTWEEVCDWVKAEPQVLCIVNMKAHALELVKALQAQGVRHLKHISTSLCPAHRRKVLDEVRQALRPEREGGGQPCRVIATQCVEAGVDLDFPKVFRALAPLDAIAQAAGRCNRHARRPEGELRVFLPEKERYPTSTYGRAAQAARNMWNAGGLDLDDPGTFRRFYAQLWQYEKTEQEELARAIQVQDYPEVARLYRLIPDDSVNVVVPYGEGLALAEEAMRDGITVEWMRRAQPFTVSVFRRRDGTLPPHCEPVNFRPRKGGQPQPAEDWFICRHTKAYDELFGFLPDGGGADWYSL